MHDKGKCRLGEGPWGAHPQGTRGPHRKSTVKQDRVALGDLYHNPDPLVCLIGESNETDVIVENAKVKGLVDSGAQISSISDKLLQLEVHPLKTRLDLEPMGGGQVPYDGYVELHM